MIRISIIVVLLAISAVAGWIVFATEASGKSKSVAFAVFIAALVALAIALVVGYFRLVVDR